MTEPVVDTTVKSGPSLLISKFAEVGTWNGLSVILLGVSYMAKDEVGFAAFGLGHNEWSIVAFIAAMVAAGVGIYFKG